MFTNFSPLLWVAVTVACYFLARMANRRIHAWWTSPLLVPCVVCLILGFALHANYNDYMRGGRWLMMLAGPATVAFALPIYKQRALLRRHWPLLIFGVAFGSTLALGSTWVLSEWLGFSEGLRLSLLPRSFTAPFAMPFAQNIGGSPDLAAVCVICTGIIGAALGGVMLRILPLRSSFARGVMFGMGAHGAGVARAREVGAEEEAVAGLVMVLAGVTCAILGPIIALLAT